MTLFSDFLTAGIPAGQNRCAFCGQATINYIVWKLRTSPFISAMNLTIYENEKGRSRIRVRIVFVPVAQELSPGFKFPGTNAWSELRYTAYSYVVPVLKD